VISLIAKPAKLLILGPGETQIRRYNELNLVNLSVPFLALAGSEVLFIVGVSVLGFALFSIRPVIHSWMMDLTPPHMAGSATSALFGTQSALSMLTPLFGGWIADQYGLGAVFYALAGMMLIANLLVAMLPNSDPGSGSDSATATGTDSESGSGEGGAKTLA